MDTSQAKKDTLDEFLSRVDTFGHRAGIESDRQLAKAIGMSKSNLPNMRAKAAAGDGNAKVLSKWWRKLEAAEARIVNVPNLDTHAVEEESAFYRGAPGPMRMNPHFALPPANPTRADVEAYVSAYLDLASQLPGGIAHAYLELLAVWPMDKLRRLLDQQQKG